MIGLIISIIFFVVSCCLLAQTEYNCKHEFIYEIFGIPMGFLGILGFIYFFTENKEIISQWFSL